MRPTARALLVPLALAACASGGARGGRPAGDANSATLEVRSNYIGPVYLYALSENCFLQRIAS